MSLQETLRAARSDLDWRSVAPRELRTLRPPAAPLRTLRRALSKARSPLILVNDKSRIMPRHLPDVVGELWSSCGQPPVLVATGTHQDDPAFYCDRFGGIPVEVHDADDAGAHAALTGDARIDRRVARADLILAFGSVEPHYFAGWTGAHKTATVGVLERPSVEVNHRHALSADSRPLALEGNPVFDHLSRLLAALEQDRRLLAVNHVLDADGGPVGLGVGTWRGSLERCLRSARERFVHQVQPANVVVAHVTGPLSRSLYQADKGIKNTEAVVKDGGLLILAADLPEGVGADRFLTLLGQAPDHDAARRAAEAGYVLGDHKAVRWRALEARGVRIRIASAGLDPASVEAAGLDVHPTLEAALEGVDPGAALLVEDAGLTVVKPA